MYICWTEKLQEESISPFREGGIVSKITQHWQNRWSNHNRNQLMHCLLVLISFKRKKNKWKKTMQTATTKMKCSCLEHPTKPQTSPFPFLSRLGCLSYQKLREKKKSQSGYSGQNVVLVRHTVRSTRGVGMSLILPAVSWAAIWGARRPGGSGGDPAQLGGDNIAFLPECFPTFQLDSTLRLLCGIAW